MCRWLAYSGEPIHLEEAILKPEHSIIDQSLLTGPGATETNGDGFGVGWYGKRRVPGVFKDIRPAWNDTNLHALAEQIESHLFFAHIRAATGSAIQRTNCHPFHYRNWLFVHNGAVRDFQALKRDLMFGISPELFTEIKGTSDSEVLFYLALTFGMADDVARGVARMAGFVEEVGRRHGVEHPLQMTLGISDGEKLYGFRYSSERSSRTLYYSENIDAIRDIAPRRADRFSSDTRAVVSEPLSDLPEVWIPMEEASMLTVHRGDVDVAAFAPESP